MHRVEGDVKWWSPESQEDSVGSDTGHAYPDKFTV